MIAALLALLVSTSTCQPVHVTMFEDASYTTEASTSEVTCNIQADEDTGFSFTSITVQNGIAYATSTRYTMGQPYPESVTRSTVVQHAAR